MKITDAFKALNSLQEDVFSLDKEGIKQLKDFTDSDDLEDEIDIIDSDADSFDDIQDSSSANKPAWLKSVDNYMKNK